MPVRGVTINAGSGCLTGLGMATDVSNSIAAAASKVIRIWLMAFITTDRCAAEPR